MNGVFIGVFNGKDMEASIIVVVTGTLHVLPFTNPCPSVLVKLGVMVLALRRGVMSGWWA